MNKQQIQSYLQKNPFDQLGDIVFKIISEEISALRLKPGENINISKIAQALDVSITPVREAIIKLNEYGFVQKYPDKKGYYVSDLELADIIKVFNARIAIEARTAFLCAQFNECPNIKRLAELAEDFKTSNTYDLLEYNDFEFHELLLRSCGNEYLIKFYNSIQKRSSRYQRFLLSNISKLFVLENQLNEDLAMQHASIINAIKQNIPVLAEHEMRNHINTGLNKILLLYNLESYNSAKMIFK